MLDRAEVMALAPQYERLKAQRNAMRKGHGDRMKRLSVARSASCLVWGFVGQPCCQPLAPLPKGCVLIIARSVAHRSVQNNYTQLRGV